AAARQEHARTGARGPRAQLPHRHARGRRQVGPPQQRLARLVRPRLLRHRDDADGRRPLRPGPLRHGGLPPVAPPGGPHDRGGAGEPEDGAGPAPGLRPDGRAEVGPRHGGVRQLGGHVQQLRHRAGRRPDRPRRRLRPRVPTQPRDAPPLDPHAAPAHQHRRDHEAAVGHRRRRRRPRRGPGRAHAGQPVAPADPRRHPDV
ncbi:MAG: NADH-ubiquinone oxidoreductase chain B, partial [uncultured Acidimicrobiales bacterium]